MREQGLHTVCEEARCPNIGECWHHGTATFMILGDVCTRACGFCAVQHGKPAALDREEPARVAEAVRSMDLRYVVITSVDRDDLEDGGAFIFAETIRLIREAQALVPHRGPHPGLPGARTAAADGARRGPGRAEPQHRDRAAALQDGAAGRPVSPGARTARPRPRLRPGNRHEVRDHGRPRRRVARGDRDARRSPRPPASASSPSGST